MTEDIVPESFDQRVYENAVTIPPMINSESRKEWYGSLLTFHTHFYSSATPKYMEEFAKIREAIIGIQDLLKDDPDEFNFQMFEIMNRWAVACSQLYEDLGLKFREQKRSGGLRHEVPEQ